MNAFANAAYSYFKAKHLKTCFWGQGCEYQIALRPPPPHAQPRHRVCSSLSHRGLPLHAASCPGTPAAPPEMGLSPENVDTAGLSPPAAPELSLTSRVACPRWPPGDAAGARRELRGGTSADSPGLGAESRARHPSSVPALSPTLSPALSPALSPPPPLHAHLHLGQQPDATCCSLIPFCTSSQSSPRPPSLTSASRSSCDRVGLSHFQGLLWKKDVFLMGHVSIHSFFMCFYGLIHPF